MEISVRDRVEGCLLAGACGDAMGVPFEFTPLIDMIVESGPLGIGEFWCWNENTGLISSETQLILFSCAALVASRYDRSVLPTEHLHSAYRTWAEAQRPMVSLDHTTPHHLEDLTKVVRQQGDRCPDTDMIVVLLGDDDVAARVREDNQNNSAVARVAPLGLLHMGDPLQAFNMAILDARITHGHPSGVVSAGAFAMLIAFLMRGWPMPRALESTLQHLKTRKDSEPTISALMKAPWPNIGHGRRPSWYGWGWTGDEALAIAVNAVLTTDDLQSALIVAASHDGDSDTTASMAGNLAGALYGVQANPPRWAKRVEMRKHLRAAAHQICKIIPESGWKRTPTHRGI